MNRTARPLTWLLTVCLLLASLSTVAAQDSLLTLQQCISLAMRNNLQHLSNYQSLINSQASLERARAPFGLRVDASLDLPTYSEDRDLRESVALQTRIQEETTNFIYNGSLTLSQRLPHLGRLSVVSTAQRQNFTSTSRADYLDVYGNMRMFYTQDLLHTPSEEISLKRAELNLTDAQYNYDLQRLRLEGQVIDAYYNLVQSIRQVEIEAQRLEQSRANLDLAQRKFEIGLIAEVEALRLRVQMLNSEASFARAETQIERSRDQLRELLGADLDAPLDVVTEVEFQQYRIDPARALEAGLKKRTDMQQAEISEQVRQLTLQDVKSRNGVTAALNANVSLLGRGDELGDISRNLGRNQWGVGIEMNLPLLDSGQRRSEIRQAEIALEQSRLSRDMQRREIVQDVRNAVRDLDEAETQITLSQAALEVAERTYEVEQSRFELGLAQSQELLDAQAELTQRQIAELDAVINYQRRLKNLRLATMADLDQLTVPGGESE